jgi:hypothetical protein
MIGSLLYIFFVFALVCRNGAYPFAGLKALAAILIALLFTGWGIMRGVKTGNANRAGHHEFERVQAELGGHPDKLFISIGDNDCFSYVSVFATPKRYPLRNILFADQPLSLRHAALLRDFAYTGFSGAIFNPKVYFRGPVPPALMQYYEKRTGKRFSWTTGHEGFKYSRITKPMPVELVIPASK